MKKTFSKIFAVAVVIAMLASLFTAVIPVSAAGAIDDISVSPSSNLISDMATYDITTTYSKLAENDTITLYFPEDTVLEGVNISTDVWFGVMEGGPPVFNGVKVDIDEDNTDLEGLILTIKVPDPAVLGAALGLDNFDYYYGDQYTIEIKDHVLNPSNAGDYSLSLGYNGGAGVDSLPYTIANQATIAIYNASGNLIRTVDNFSAAVAVAKDNYTIKLGEGTYESSAPYDEDPDPNFDLSSVYEGVTLTATGALEETVIKGTLNVGITGATVSGITVKGAVNISGDDVEFDGCAFVKKDPPMKEELFTNEASGLIVSECAFDTTAGSVQDTAFIMASGATNTTVKDSTFNLDQTAGLRSDYAVYMDALLTPSGSPPSVLTVMGCTFTGSSGIGYYDEYGNDGVSIKNNTFTSLESAMVIAGVSDTVPDDEDYPDTLGVQPNMVTFQGNTVSDCTKATAGAIVITEAAAVNIINNVITDNTGFSVHSTASANVWVIGNQFSNNTKGMFNNGDTLNAPLNYWDSADGPTTETAPAGDTIANLVDTIVYEPFLSVAPTGVEFSTGMEINYHTGSFATVTGWEGTGGDFMSAMKLSAKPAELAEPPYPAIAYYDIYNGGDASTADIQVKLYADGIASNTKAFYFSNLTGNWIQCYPTAVAANGAYVQFSVKVDDPDVKGYTPLAEDLTGTVFALVQGDAAQPAAFDIAAPEQGTTTDLTNVAFAWTPYPNATSYQFVLSTKFDLSSPVVKQDLSGVSTTAYIYTGNLTAGAYYWQVMAYKNNAVVAKSSLGTFIAEAAAGPVVTPPAATTYTTFTLPAPTTLTVTQAAPTTYTIETPPAEQITPAWIWVLIVIGAILVIVVIVLIVRTRRAA